MSFPRYNKYKQSGVPWLGDVPEHWGICKVRYLFEIKKRIAGEEGYDVLSITQKGIRVKDIESGDGQLSMDYSKYQFVEVGDFAMNHMDLLTGYVDVASSKGVTSPDYRVFSIRNTNSCDSRYYLYLFQMGYQNKIFYAYGQGASQLGRWRLPTDEFNNLEFPFPDISEQKSIAVFLDRETAKIDALVAEKERLIELLKEKRQAVISHAVTKGLNPKTPMKPSGIDWLGDIPEHWEVKPLKYIASCNDEVLGDNTDDGYEIEYIEISGVSANDGITEMATVKFGEAPSRARRKIKHGDIIVSTVRTYLRAISPVVNPEENWIASTGFAVIRPKSIKSDYLGYVFKSEFLISEIIARSVGISYPAINASEVMHLKIVMPPEEEQVQIANFLSQENKNTNDLLSQTQKAIDLLQERRTALISAAVTGKIDVRGITSNQNQEAA